MGLKVGGKPESRLWRPPRKPRQVPSILSPAVVVGAPSRSGRGARDRAALNSVCSYTPLVVAVVVHLAGRLFAPLASFVALK